MYIPKKYGQSKSNQCPFCNKNAVTENKQSVPVCTGHKDNLIPDQKCICGSWLELMSGKFGPYFNCMKCGSINFNKITLNIPKAIINKTFSQSKTPNAPTTPKKELIVRSDDPRFFS